jgi:hypothetical protein
MMAGSGKALLDWPLAQQGAGVLPFLIGIWVAAPARYVLWAAAVVVDLVFAILTSGNREAVLRGLEHDRRARERRREAAVRRRGRRPARRMPPVPAFQITRVNRPHLGERLGLFTIIVLGEAVTQIVTATTRIDWAWAVAASTAAGFLAVIGLWWLTFQYGFTGSPQEQVTRLRAGVALPVHLASTAGIVGLSVGLGAAVTDAGDGVPGALRWVGCAALALYVAASAVGGALSGAPAVWLAAWALPALVLPIVAAALWGERWPGWLLAVVLAAVIGWMTCYGPVRRWWARYRGRNGVLVDQSEGP